MIGSVLLVDATTLSALPGCVAWINKDYGNASALRLVGDEATKLGKSPVSQSCSLVTTGRNPVADTFEFFKGNAASGAFSVQYESFGDCVVGVFLEPRLFTGQLAQTPLSSLGATLLQPIPAFLVMAPYSLNIGARVDFTVAIDGQRDDTEINTKPVFGLELGSFWDVARRGEHPFAAHKAQINLAFAVGHQASLMVPHHDRDHDATFNGPQTDCGTVFDEADNAIVIWLGGVGAEMSLGIPIQLVGVGDFGDAADGGLSGQPEAGPGLGVTDLMQRVLPKCPGFPRKFRKPIAGCIAAFERRHQACGLIRRRHELQGGNQLHSFKYGDYSTRCQDGAMRPALSLPALKDRVSRGEHR